MGWRRLKIPRGLEGLGRRRAGRLSGRRADVHHIEDRSQGDVVAQAGHLLVRLSLQDGQDLPGVGQRLGLLFHVTDRVSLDPIVCRTLSQDICDRKQSIGQLRFWQENRMGTLLGRVKTQLRSWWLEGSARMA